MKRSSTFGRRAICVLVAVCALVGVAAPARSVVADDGPLPRLPVPVEVGALDVGGAAFWDGELYLERAVWTNWAYGATINHPVNQPVAETCVSVEPCWAYTLDVAKGARRLRVTIDTNKRTECYQVELWAPNTYEDRSTKFALAKLHCPDNVPAVFPMLWDMEGVIDNPAAGQWVVRVVPFNVTNWGFRLRAVLDGAPPAPETALPDLHPLPAYEFGFSAPASPTAGAAPDGLNPAGPASCTADEIDEAQRETGEAPVRCLRFSAGIYNIGEGLLDLRLRDGGSVLQRVRRTDGEVVREQPAGSWESGGTHLHNHLHGWVDFRLYKVVDVPSHPDPNARNLQPMPGRGHKLGWHDNDQRLYDWRRFDSWPGLAEFERCRQEDECIIVSPGWGDHYRSNRPGMYVDFPLDVAGSADGDYLVRMTVDPGESIEESDEHNNTGYAWIRVAGDDVTICERGIGTSPWDPRKKLHEPNFWLNTPGGTPADSPSRSCS